MQDFNPDEWIHIHLYTAEGGRRDKPHLQKAWCMFKNPETGEWMSGFGQWDPNTLPTITGVVGRLTVLPIKDKSPNADWNKTMEKKRKGYQHVHSRRGFYINLHSREVINVDRAPVWVHRAMFGDDRTERRIYPTPAPSPEPAPAKPEVADPFARIDKAAAPEWF